MQRSTTPSPAPSRSASSGPGSGGADRPWSPDSWAARPAAQAIAYPDDADVARAVAALRALPPLVTSGEIEKLSALLAQAQEGKRFLLQGGDCAESLDDCTPDQITSKLKILLQMSLVLVHGMKRPVIRVGRLAGQYAKPRSKATETIDGVELPSYFGDLVNANAFTVADRTPDPQRMVRAYERSAVTLNFVRSLIDGGFADLHHPEAWDLRFVDHAQLRPSLRAEYQRMVTQLTEALKFAEALGDKGIDELSRVEFFTSHEGLNLLYEQAQTRRVPRREGWWDLTCHMPWIGERTRGLDGAHVEFFRGIANPVGVKVGPTAEPGEVVRLCRALNPGNRPGKLVVIHRMGAEHCQAKLPPILAAVMDAQLPVLWCCDPMHGNTRLSRPTVEGMLPVKTRRFDDILSELEMALDCHEQLGTWLGGVHFELTGEDVTECVGGGAGVTDADLDKNYASLCDPRLNYQQALELAFLLAKRLPG
jgi:3-deoxy-7-phosphoheptulonate synthase